MADAAPAVLITGATSGLGRYLAMQLAGSGWQVLTGSRFRELALIIAYAAFSCSISRFAGGSES